MSRSRVRRRPNDSGADEGADAPAERVRERAARVASEQRREAEAKLDAQGGLTEAQRETLAELADAIAADLVEPSAETLARDGVDTETRRAIASLFGVDADRPRRESSRPPADD